MKFLITFLVAVLVTAGIYCGLAYVINPRGEFPHNLFPNLIADSLSEKQHLFQAFQRQHRVGGLILGSSRSMKLRPALFERAYGKSFFNFAINSAHAEEMLLVYDWARSQGAHPKVVVLGLDMSALHSNDISILRHQEIVKLRGEIDARPARAPSLGQQALEQARILKGDCTVSFVEDMIRSAEIKVAPARFTTKLQTFDSDGYEHYPRYEAQRRAGTFNLDARINGGLDMEFASFKSMTGLSARRKGDLERLIAEIQGDGGQVVLWLTPAHPRVIELVSHRTPYRQRLQEFRAYARGLRASFGIAVYDCTEIGRFGGTATDWYDAVHIDENNADRIAALILAGR